MEAPADQPKISTCDFLPASTALPRPSTAPPSKAFLGAILCACGVSSSAGYAVQVGREPGGEHLVRFFTHHAPNLHRCTPKPRLAENGVQQRMSGCRAWPLLRTTRVRLLHAARPLGYVRVCSSLHRSTPLHACAAQAQGKLSQLEMAVHSHISPWLRSFVGKVM